MDKLFLIIPAGSRALFCTVGINSEEELSWKDENSIKDEDSMGARGASPGIS